MCGRYSLSLKGEKLEKRFNAKLFEKIQPRYNAGPSQNLPVITNKEPDKIQLFQWGLVPFWAKDTEIGSKLINARSETLFEKPSFRESAKTRRCLIPADGFYEWKAGSGGKRIPHRITMKNEETFAFAGLWDSWEMTEGFYLNSFTIITTSANSLIAGLHERMPVILPKSEENKWIKPELSQGEANSMFIQFPAEEMKVYPVSTELNKVENDYPELAMPSTGQQPGQSLSLFS